MKPWAIHHGDCLEVLKGMKENSVDAVVTDPPYGLSFMGKKWDYDVPGVEVWREVLRVLKPGGHALIACGTRTQHRMVVNIEDAGFEIRDVVTWLYGQGFPKNLDISKAIDKAAGAERTEVIGRTNRNVGTVTSDRDFQGTPTFRESAEARQASKFIKAPTTDSAKNWSGWGTALKPACEFWTLARKPLSEKNVAANVLKWGAGGINVAGCRIATESPRPQRAYNGGKSSGIFGDGLNNSFKIDDTFLGRFPANLILDELAAAALDEQSGTLNSGAWPKRRSGMGFSGGSGTESDARRETNVGGASRFFYCAKVSPSERDAGLEDAPDRIIARSGGAQKALREGNVVDEGPTFNAAKRVKNNHPTVKPVKLMRYLCKLITRPNGLVLDPFAGSGSTGVAAIQEGFRFVGIEREAEYWAIAEMRMISVWNGGRIERETDSSGQTEFFPEVVP